MCYKIGDIVGVEIVELNKFSDERGFLIEAFREDNLPDGLKPVMSYISFTKPGIARGPHEHGKQTDIFAFIGPGDFEIQLWDNRKESETFSKKMIINAGEKCPITLIVPPGIVHGYKNISEVDGMVVNYPDKLFKGYGKQEKVDEIRHEDQEGKFYLDFIK